MNGRVRTLVPPRCTVAREAAPARILRAHGGGGTAMKELLEGVVFPALSGRRGLDPNLRLPDDAAVLSAPDFLRGRLAFTTDGFVVQPPFFPGGDLGRLSVCGTVNDLAVSGARPLALSLALVVEEGFPVEDLRRVLESAAAAAEEAGVAIVTGDTKVLDRRGEGEPECYAVTAGIGIVPEGRVLDLRAIRPGDRVLVSGPIADHGVAVLSAREGIGLEGDVRSDAAPLSGLVEAVLSAAPGTRFLRDATRGGVAAVLCEIAEAAGVAIEVEEAALPIRDATRAACELLGLDPLVVANEGVLVAVVPEDKAEAARAALRATPRGESARIVGRVGRPDAGGPRVVLATAAGGRRIVAPPYGEELPRIC